MGVEQNSNQNRAEEYQNRRKQIKGESTNMRQLAANMFKAALNEKLANKPSDAEKIAMVIAAAQKQALGSPEKQRNSVEKPNTALEQLNQKNLELKAAVDKLGLPRGYKFDGTFIRNPDGEAIAVFSAKDKQFKLQHSEYSHSLYLSAEALVAAIHESVKDWAEINNKKIEAAIRKLGLPRGYSFKNGLIRDQKGRIVGQFDAAKGQFMHLELLGRDRNGLKKTRIRIDGSAVEMLHAVWAESKKEQGSSRESLESPQDKVIRKMIQEKVGLPILKIVGEFSKNGRLTPKAELKITKTINEVLFSKDRATWKICKQILDSRTPINVSSSLSLVRDTIPGAVKDYIQGEIDNKNIGGINEASGRFIDGLRQIVSSSMK